MKSRTIQITALVLALCFIATGIYYYMPVGTTTVVSDAAISTYNETRDKAEILKIFEKDRYWLISSEDYSPEHMLDNRAPNKREARYYGALQIKVLRENDAFVGFIAYYMRNFFVGQILFVAVKEEFRGKGYAQRLLRYAIGDLQKMGATLITLVTRTSNTSAQSAYKKLGFVESYKEDGFVYFELRP